MSVMTRPKRPAQGETKAPEGPKPPTNRTAEAPDRGAVQSNREAPDSGRLKIAEAPDAGEGRQAQMEHEFTHGRSQS